VLDQKSQGAAGRLGDAAVTGSARVKMLTKMATRRGVMSLLDDRAETNRELADLYARWEQQVTVQHGLLGHLVLESLALLLGILLLASLAAVAARALVMRLIAEPRQARTLRTVLTLVVEVVAVLMALLVVFGVPQQMPTILGLATAGLTVVFQDFILAFFGWFILMGPNGIRMNDWVEINGVGGEVAEIGLFRTTLLETGNWTARGHPTGRRVTLINSFAIRGQYFNFTTHGQWMWDEIRLSLPATPKVYELIRQMQQAVEQETAENSARAALEWQRVHPETGLGQFSAQPTVDLRPSAAGVEIVVRFVTRAGERFEVANRIFEALMKLQRDGLALPPAGDAA
jgi:small-conductance mechanosensitive channel